MKTSGETFFNFKYHNVLEGTFLNEFSRALFIAGQAKRMDKINRYKMAVSLCQMFNQLFLEKQDSSDPDATFLTAVYFVIKSTLGNLCIPVGNLDLNIFIPILSLSKRIDSQNEYIASYIKKIFYYHVFGLISVLKNSSFCGHADEGAKDFIFLI